MSANDWYWILGIIGGLATILSLLIWILPPSKQRPGAIWAATFVGIVAVILIATRHDESIADVMVSHDPGTYQVADFLEFLSHGPFTVTMEQRTADDLRRRHTKITTPNLNRVSLQYVLEKVLTPQLPGPEQWTYEVVGKTVVIKRR